MAYKVVFGGITFWPHGTPLRSPLGAIMLCSKVEIHIFIKSSLIQPEIAYVKTILMWGHYVDSEIYVSSKMLKILEPFQVGCVAI